MSSSTLGLAPEIEAVLADIARDENSTLFRVPTSKLSRFAASGGRADLTGLSIAEKHLMQTHRVEVAQALRELCRLRLWEHPAARTHLMLRATDNEDFKAPPENASIRRARQAAAVKESQALTSKDFLTLGSPAEAEPIESASVTQLAAASLRLQPTDQARIYCALENTFHGNPEAARAIFRTIINSAPGSISLSFALTNLGLCHSTAGRHGIALGMYEAAANLATGRPMPAMSALVSAALAGTNTVIEYAADRIDNQYERNHPAVNSFTGLTRRQVKAGMITHSTHPLQGRRRFRDSASSRILDALLPS